MRDTTESEKINFKSTISALVQDEHKVNNAKVRRRLKRLIEIVDQSLAENISPELTGPSGPNGNQENKGRSQETKLVSKDDLNLAVSKKQVQLEAHPVVPEVTHKLVDCLTKLRSATDAAAVDDAIATASANCTDISCEYTVVDFLRQIDLILGDGAITIQSKLKRKLNRLKDAISAAYEKVKPSCSGYTSRVDTAGVELGSRFQY